MKFGYYSEGTSRLKAFCTPFINQKITHFYCYSSSKGKPDAHELQSNKESLRLRYIID